MNAATILLLSQVTRGGGYQSVYRPRTPSGYGAAYAGKATTIGGAGTDPDDDKWAVALVVLATCAALACCVMMSLFLKPIL